MIGCRTAARSHKRCKCGRAVNRNRRPAKCARCRVAALVTVRHCPGLGQPCGAVLMRPDAAHCRNCYLLNTRRARLVEREDMVELLLSGLTPVQIAQRLGVRDQYVRCELGRGYGGVQKLSHQLGVYVGPART